MQVILGEFVTAQMAYHAKALELYTMAFQHTQSIAEEEAVEVSGGEATHTYSATLRTYIVAWCGVPYMGKFQRPLLHVCEST